MGNSPGSDPASVSMTTLRGPLSESSWGFLSRVMSSLCFHKAFLVSAKKSNKGSVNKKQQAFHRDCFSIMRQSSSAALSRKAWLRSTERSTVEKKTEMTNYKLILGIFVRLTEVVEPVGVGSIFIIFLHKLEVMGSLVGNHAWVLPATVDNISQALPRVFLHKELRWHILHFHHLCIIRKAVHSRHAHSHTAARWHYKELISGAETKAHLHKAIHLLELV